MEPVSTAIVAALAAGVSAALKDVATQGIKDAYAGLKTLIVDRYKRKAAVEAVAEDPESQAQRAALAEALEKTGAAEDPDIVAEAERLSEELSKLPLETAPSLGLDIEDFEAENARFKDFATSGTAARLRRVKVKGDFVAEGIQSGLATGPRGKK